MDVIEPSPTTAADPFATSPPPLPSPLHTSTPRPGSIPRPGQLTPGWKTIFIVGWVSVMAGFGAMAQAGRIAGLSPWWLGPETDPRAFYVIVLPFIAPIIVISLASAGSRFACAAGIVAAIPTAAIALGDLQFPGLAIGEAVIGAAALLISVACLAGRFRRPEPPAPAPSR